MPINIFNGNLAVIREKVRQLKSPIDTTFDPSTDIVRTASHQTEFTYDYLHRQISRTIPGDETEYKAYDSQNRLTLELDFKEQATGYFYDTLGRLTDKKYYAADGTTDGQNTNYPDTYSEAVHYTYDNLGHKLTETATDYTGAESVITYCAVCSYDNDGRLKSIEVQQGDQRYKLEYVYSLITGQKTDTTLWKPDGSSGWIEDTSTNYSYDALGRLEIVTADIRNGTNISEQTTYDYDSVGNRESTTLPNGVYTEYSCNALNRLTDLVHYQTSEKLSTISSFVYQLNAQGMRTGITEVLAETRHLNYTYDSLNRLTDEYSDNKADSNIDDLTPPSDIRGYKSNYVYDLVGNRQSRIVNVHNDSGQQDLETAYDYYSGTDRLWHEYQVGPELAFQWGGETVYVYALTSGGWSYQLSDRTGRIGSLAAFALGLPTEWNRWLLITLMILLPVIYFAPVLVQQWRRLKGSVDRQGPPDLKLWHRCLCVLFSYIFLVGPECFQMLACADTQYSQLSTASWGSGNRTITYQYDANGSLTHKTTTKTLEQTTVEDIVYDYNLQNRLAKVTTTPYTDGVAGSAKAVEYKYNPDGIRVEKKETTTSASTRTDYLIDPANPTGYTQVLQEVEYDITTPASPVPLNRTDYVLGDDVISQTLSTWNTSAWTTGDTQYLLYDGHGSTRQLINADLSIQDSYSYDGYGIMLGDSTDPQPANSADTNLLYSGEQYDKNLSQYYLRARYYNPAKGLFNQMDPFAGNQQDPQSLHKYTYVHNNPVNGIDPTGEEYSTIETLTVGSIMTQMMATMLPVIKVGLLVLTAAAVICLVHDLAQEYQVAGMTAIAEAILGSAKQISDAFRDAAKALKDTIENLLKQKPYFVFERVTPNIYKFTASCLIWNPAWYYLTWHGDPVQTAKNRAWILGRYGHLRKPGQHIDEFPYASTLEGGSGAKGCSVPALENFAQGGYLKAHYYGILRKPMTRFLVIPVPK